MARKIDDTLAGVLKKYGADPKTDIWDCHGTWVAYHRTLERIAAQAGIVFDPPTVIRSEADECVIAVTGKLGDRTEWSFGEARIGLNYRVSDRQAGYPYAMAEKRGKDRVIIKLVGLAGHVYSEEESDDFKPGSQPSNETKATTTSSAPTQEQVEDCGSVKAAIIACKTVEALKDLAATPLFGESVNALHPELANEMRREWSDRKAFLADREERKRVEASNDDLTGGPPVGNGQTPQSESIATG